jgi:hypothetical protein
MFWAMCSAQIEPAKEARVRSFMLGYWSKYTFAVAKGLLAGLLVHISLDAMSFSHCALFLFCNVPPVASRYCPMDRAKDS